MRMARNMLYNRLLYMQTLLPLMFPPFFVGAVPIERNLLVVQCAWCRKDIKLTFTPGDPGISHGMCQSCLERLQEEAA